MATVVGLFPSAVGYGGSWTYADGGPIECSFSWGGSPVEDRTGDSFYPTFVGVVNGYCRASVTLRDISTATGLTINGSPTSLVFTFNNKVGGTGTTFTMSNMIVTSVDPVTQGQGTPGSAVVHFVHQSADGSTSPI